jgi:hypothetical protein
VVGGRWLVAGGRWLVRNLTQLSLTRVKIKLIKVAGGRWTNGAIRKMLGV